MKKKKLVDYASKIVLVTVFFEKPDSSKSVEQDVTLSSFPVGPTPVSLVVGDKSVVFELLKGRAVAPPPRNEAQVNKMKKGGVILLPLVLLSSTSFRSLFTVTNMMTKTCSFFFANDESQLQCTIYTLPEQSFFIFIHDFF